VLILADFLCTTTLKYYCNTITSLQPFNLSHISSWKNKWLYHYNCERIR